MWASPLHTAKHFLNCFYHLFIWFLHFMGSTYDNEDYMLIALYFSICLSFECINIWINTAVSLNSTLAIIICNEKFKAKTEQNIDLRYHLNIIQYTFKASLFLKTVDYHKQKYVSPLSLFTISLLIYIILSCLAEPIAYKVIYRHQLSRL